jgi:hypothetical protein
MSLLKKLFGFFDKEKTYPVNNQPLPWIEASDNPWNVKLLDLRPVTKEQVFFTNNKDHLMNYMSFGGENGKSFWGIIPNRTRTINVHLSYPCDEKLEPGVLFLPASMEQKWAIFFDGENIIIVSSRDRAVILTAKATPKNNELIIESITGILTPIPYEPEDPSVAFAAFNYMMISHAYQETTPVPLLERFAADPRAAAEWAFRSYGNLAELGVFDEKFMAQPKGKLRSDSLLHIAILNNNHLDIEDQLKKGANIHAISRNGLSTLEWAIFTDNTDTLKKILALGADPNLKNPKKETPIMTAASENKVLHIELLLQAGALINATCKDGFTALHRAAYHGHKDTVQFLLSNGADKNISSEDETALSFAIKQNHLEIAEILSK